MLITVNCHEKIEKDIPIITEKCKKFRIPNNQIQ